MTVEAAETYNPNPEPEVVAEREEARSGALGLDPSGRDKTFERRAARETARRAGPRTARRPIAGEGLPAAVLDYIAGAIEFQAGRLDAAAEYFEAIDRLSPAQRRIRTVAAAYMLGRIRQRTGEFDAARKAFQAVRARANAGAPDPMGLAVASLGEEARIDLVEVGLVSVQWEIPRPRSTMPRRRR